MKLLLILLLLMVASPVQATQIRGQNVFHAVNAERIAQGREALRVNPMLVAAAQAKANDMVTHHYFAHRSPNGWALNDFARGYRYVSLGENLARNYSSTEDLIQGWMGSVTHRANILDKDYRETGIGIAQDEEGRTYITQYFGN